MKREPILADKLLAECERTYKWQRQALDTLTEAKRFVLDANAATYVAQMIHDHPRVIADAMDFAIPPMRKMWIELPYPPFFHAITGRYSDVTADNRVGYLLDGPGVMVGACGDVRAGAQMMPIQYVLNRPLTLEQEVRLVEKLSTSRAQLDPFFWGESYLQLANEWDKEGIRAMRANHSFHLLECAAPPDVVFDTLLNGGSGDMRNILALLLFLNRTREVQVVKDYGFERRMINRKPGALVTYSEITIHVDPKPIIKKLVAGEGVRHRIHDVRGHFCHDFRARQAGKLWCSHDWEEYKPLHWRCPRCNGQRWWRREHTRGHFEEGMVIQQYNVTK